MLPHQTHIGFQPDAQLAGFSRELVARDLCAVNFMSERIRQAKASDAIAMHRVRMSVQENRLISTRISDDDYAAAVEESGRGWVIELGESVVAFAVGNAVNGSIWALFVDPAHEGRGYGRWLHDVMVTWLWEQGHDQLWLTTALSPLT